MKVVIPMSGNGSRFVSAGYENIKPLILFDKKPFIEWVCKIYPIDTDFIFICQKKHLESTELRKELLRIAPKAQIVPIEAHKLGPVYAVKKAYDNIPNNESVIVNYCDFYMHWDYHNFVRTVQQNNCAGAVPCYTGFHPHLMHPNNIYATALTDSNSFALELKEKNSFFQDKTKDLHSAGTYYFRSGAILKEYFDQLMNNKQTINGEYYVSMVYELMIRDKLPVYIYDEITHFCQWGTPADFEEFLYWANIFTPSDC